MDGTTLTIPVLRALVDELPAELDYLFAAADIQGRAIGEEPARLAGCALAERIARFDGLGGAACGALLCGDWASDVRAEKRGVTDDVDSVWAAFADAMSWVVGVDGNHDLNTPPPHAAPVSKLDGNCVRIGGLLIGGVGGIVRQVDQAQQKAQGHL